MPHKHVQYTVVHPDLIEAGLKSNQVTTRCETRTLAVGKLADGSREYKLRWLVTGGGHELSWGVTTTPRRGVDNAKDKANGARVFVQGIAECLEEAASLLQTAIRGVVQAQPPPSAFSSLPRAPKAPVRQSKGEPTCRRRP